MTNEELFQDLKQFISVTLSQQLSGIETSIDKLDNRMDKIDNRMEHLETKIDDVDAKVDTILETVGGQLIDHDSRITKLEQAAA